MSNLSEEEIIKHIRERIDTCNGWGQCVFVIKEIQGLLDRYNNLKQIEKEHQKLNGELREELNREKEKNKELQNELLEKDLHIDGLKEDRRIAIEEIQEKNYVSKDKVIECLDDIIDYFDNPSIPDEDNQFLEKKKKELLEEE